MRSTRRPRTAPMSLRRVRRVHASRSDRRTSLRLADEGRYVPRRCRTGIDNEFRRRQMERIVERLRKEVGAGIASAKVRSAIRHDTRTDRDERRPRRAGNCDSATGAASRMSRARAPCQTSRDERTDEHGPDRPGARPRTTPTIAVSPMTANDDDGRGGREPESTQAECEPDEHARYRENEHARDYGTSVEVQPPSSPQHVQKSMRPAGLQRAVRRTRQSVSHRPWRFLG